MDNEELQSLLNSSQANQNQLKTKVTFPLLFYSNSNPIDLQWGHKARWLSIIIWMQSLVGNFVTVLQSNALKGRHVTKFLTSFWQVFD